MMPDAPDAPDAPDTVDLRLIFSIVQAEMTSDDAEEYAFDGELSPQKPHGRGSFLIRKFFDLSDFMQVQI